MTAPLARQFGRVALLALLFIGKPHDARAAPPPPPVLTVSADTKQLEFSWQAVADASYYVVRESTGVGAPLVAVSPKIPQRFVGSTMTFSLDVAVHRLDWLNATYVVQACGSATLPICSFSIPQNVVTLELDAIGRIEARNVDAGDRFGYAIAASADGTTVAIGAPYEDCSCAGVNPPVIDELGTDSGAVHVFVKSASGWTQQAFIKAGAGAPFDAFGMTVALSGDGNTLAIGVPTKTYSAGEVHVYARGGSIWKPRGILTPSNGDLSDHFGAALALSEDGDTLAIGASGEDSSGTGTTATGLDDDEDNSGAVYMYTRAANGLSWSQSAFIKGSHSDVGDSFGVSVALNARGTTLAVGAEREASTGAVDVYDRNSAGVWSHANYVQLSASAADDLFGSAVALSADGLRLAVGAVGEDGGAAESGAAYVFTRTGTKWIQDDYIKSSNVSADDYFGGALAFDESGTTLAVSARREDGSDAGVSGTPDEVLSDAGAAFLFERSSTDTQWTEVRYVKAPDPGASDRFGGTFFRGAIALSRDGDTLIVPAADDDGLKDATSDSGAVFLY